MRRKIKTKEVALAVIYVCILLLIYIIPFSETFNVILAIGVIVLSFIWVYKCWNNTCLLILSLFIAYSNYSIVMGVYIDKQLRPLALYNQITDVKVYGIGIASLFLLMLSLALFTKKIQKKEGKSFSNKFIKKENRNLALLICFWILFHIIMLVGYQRGDNTRGKTSPLYEYGVICLILMFYFSGFDKRFKVFFIESTAAYVLTSLPNGTRIEALICMIIFVLCFFEKGIKHSVLFAGMIAGLFLFSIVGTIRGNWLILRGNTLTILSEIFKQKFVFDTCLHAYFPVLCMIETFKDFNISISIYYLFKFLLTIISGQSRVIDGDLIQVVRKTYYHNFGGCSIGFFYVWFSYLGGYLFSLLIRFYINQTTIKKESISRVCALLYLVATCPRWYLYGPWSCTRGVLICLLVLHLSNMASKLVKRNTYRKGFNIYNYGSEPRDKI